MKKFLVLVSIFFLSVKSASAHVAYVVGHDEMMNHMGNDWNYVWQTVSNPTNLLMMIITTVLVLLAAAFVIKSKDAKPFLKHIEDTLSSYYEFIPWIIRLSLGIALIGAGVEHVFISPIVEHADYISTLEVVLGFYFIIGFLLVPATLITIGIYIIGLSHEMYLIGNLDFLGLAIAFLVFHSARPGVDDILGFSLIRKIHIPRHWVSIITRVSVGVAMIFLALYEKILNPHAMELVITKFHLTNMVPVSVPMWVIGVGLTELVIGILLVLGFYTRTVASIGILVLCTTFFIFQESVYAHITLFGILSIVAIEGGGDFSIDSFLNLKNKKLATK